MKQTTQYDCYICKKKGEDRGVYHYIHETHKMGDVSYQVYNDFILMRLYARTVEVCKPCWQQHIQPIHYEIVKLTAQLNKLGDTDAKP